MIKPALSPQRARQHWDAGQQAAQARLWPQAALQFEQAAECAPGDALVWMNLARALMHSQRNAQAQAAAARAFGLDRNSPLACRLLAECQLHDHRYADAVATFEALGADAPRDVDLLAAHGNALFMARRPREAIDVYFHALALKIDDALIHYRLGLAFRELALTREASECFRTTIALDRGKLRALSLSLLLHESQQACDWRQIDADTSALIDALDDTDDRIGQLLSPFVLLAIDSTPAQQRRVGALRTQGLTAGVVPLPPAGPRRSGPIRLGYLSADFCQHATALLIVELLERHDASRFEVFLYSHSVDDGSALQARVRAACAQWVDVTHLGDAEVAQRMRDDGLDIVIDLKGHTRDSRFEILARRPARVQATWLGYPATTGADFIDYVIGDAVVTPLAHAPNYSEKIAQLPGSYQPNDRQRPLPPRPSRASLGLPDAAVVLCCFNQSYKISPQLLDLWAQILRGAPDAVLWMLAWNAHSQANLQRELHARGVPADRVHFAAKLPLDQHIARLRAADLFLDTWPYNAHTTASEALWAGVPVLTVPGATFASRAAASLVSACGLPDLACATPDAYVQMATALANDRELLAGLRQHLDVHRPVLPLFDSLASARALEALLLRMHERALAGLAPAALAAQPVLPLD